MRTSNETIKEAIGHADQDVREVAVRYFSDSFSPDPSIMPLVIEVCQRHGLDAFEFYSFVSDLAQTDETVRWLIQEIERIGDPSSDRAHPYANSLMAALRNAEPALLKRHEQAIHAMTHLDDASQRAIDVAIRLNSSAFDELWRELTDFCENEDKVEDAGRNLDYAHRVVDALARFHAESSAKTMAVLENKEEQGWLEVMATRLAGRLRLEVAIPHLFDQLVEFDTWVADEANSALVRIGSDEVVKQAVDRLGTKDWDHSLTAAFLLTNLHGDLSVASCLMLLESERDTDVRGRLLQAILRNFATEGIELARQYVLSTPKSPDLLEVRSDLLTCYKLLGGTFPEFEAWTEDARHDREFRRNWYTDAFLNLPGVVEALEEDDFESDEEFADEVAYEPSLTIVRQQERIGRNDPCPCGSGKKYKKCCYRKAVL